ncbi:hypothetical protein DRE_04566 [Drechslerella stenobrocha 248]|uniref:CFEM domain-containing protein n=1 Tax=Drechslerella stenobrocha 248 TaxID=1043628 RepID=W7I1S0_9PEZI|nr:hypothetical protein DRE_04566 [Drechslerella stenobrocha 248]
MKFSAVVLVAAAAVASAQSIGDIPACAQTCLLPALQATGCDLTDFKCSCSNKDFVSGSTASASDAEKAAAATYGLCKSVGVTIETQPVPGATSPAASEPAAPSTSAAAPVVESTSAAAPVVESSTEATVVAPSTSAAAVPTYGGVPTGAPSSAPIVSTIISSTKAGNATQPTAPPAPTYTGAAAVVAGNAILAVGGAIAAFFL